MALLLDLGITNDGTTISISGLTTTTNSEWTSIDDGNGETITGVVFKVWKGCTHCSSCTDEEYLNAFDVGLELSGDYFDNTAGDVVTLDSATFLQTAVGTSELLDFNVYHIDIIITGVDDDTVTFEQQYHLCTFAKGTVACSIIKAIVDKEKNSNDIVTVFEALKETDVCENCCKTCELFAYLQTLLQNLENCISC